MYRKKLLSIDDLKVEGYQIEPDEILVDVEVENLLAKRGWSVSVLSEKTGVSRQTIHNIINGSYTAGIDLALKISKVLEVPVEEIFKLKDIAWFSRTKKANEKTLYFDHLHCALVDHEVVEKHEKTHGISFIDQKTGELISKVEKEQWESEYFEELRNNPVKLSEAMDINIDIDKRKLPRMVKEYVNKKSNNRFIPTFQKVVKRIPQH